MSLSSMVQRALRNAARRAPRKRLARRPKIRLDTLEDRTAPAVGTLQFQVASSLSAEGVTPVVEVRLQTTDSPLNGSVVVGVTDAGGGTATGGGTDYTLTSGGTVTFNSSTPFTFEGGDRVYRLNIAVDNPLPSQAKILTVVDDRRVEASESANLQLSVVSSPSDAITLQAGGNLLHSLTITENDSATVTVAAGTTTDSENAGTADVAVTLNLITAGDTGATEELAVPVSANLPTGHADYGAAGVTFNPGAVNNDVLNVVITAVNDRRIEASTETFADQALAITSTGGANVTAVGSRTIAVTDNDRANLSIPDATMTKTEGESENITVTLTPNLDGVGTDGLDVSVAVNLAGNADYTATGHTFNPGDLTGAPTGTISVLAVDDNIVEPTETFTNQGLVVTTAADFATAGSETIVITDNDTATFTIDDATVNEADGTATFTVSLSNPIDIDFAVDVNYGGGTATGGGVDYDSATDQVTFLANTTAPQTVTVAINNESLVEATETFIASLAAATPAGGRSINTGDTGTGTITDNDTGTFTVNDVTVDEAAGTLTFTVSLDNPIDIPIAVDVSYANGTATGGIDFDSGTDLVTFPPESTASQIVTVAINDDNIVEATENFLASLSTATALGGRSVVTTDTATGTITDNDTATFAIEDVSVSEGGTLTFTVSLTNPLDIDIVIDVNYGGGSAIGGGVDYDSATDSLTFPAGSTSSQTVTVTTSDDNIVEATETFIASLSTATPLGGRSVNTADTATGTITDNDTATFTITNVTANEGDGTLTFTVSLDNPLDIPITIDVSYLDGSATGGNIDYDSTTDQATFAAGTTAAQTVTVTLNNENLVEATESFSAQLATATALGARTVDVTDTATGTITDNDTATFTINDVSVNEAAGTLTFTVSLDNPIDIPVTVDVNYTDQTATGGGVDYDSSADQVVFGTGSTTPQTVTVNISDNGVVEATETFLASLSTATAIGDRSVNTADTGIGTITDNDAASVTINDVTVNEADGTATFTVSLNNPIDIDLAVNVNYGGGTATGGGVDYDSATDQVTFTAGSTADQTVTVAIANNNVVEATETFLASLAAASAIGDRNINFTDTGTGTITDNDTATFTIGDISVTEGGTATFTVSLDTAIDIPFTVNVSYGGGTATGGGVDYDSATDQVTFSAGSTAGQTATVTITNENLVEATETSTPRSAPRRPRATGRSPRPTPRPRPSPTTTPRRLPSTT